ncbi:DNA polymerase III subunit chi [Alteromonas pelagimontana]|uniref:DNA polymerase III subunit chi n=1 Tax=Alteromonas pelagimontana TaxID=1858656 RepID=A0A6M4MBX9_9ALTE|nr:DNA polymerase III subunit chi [Alteromonas pelagimontana]QJR80140.1 DNA polymerase III subunit chi [Alteromonas pelagimontana]
MPQVTFYSLPDENNAAAVKACNLIAEAYSRKQRCAVLCASQQAAETVDDLLWQLPADRFVPHNMVGEGPPTGTPVEICWEESQLSRRNMVVNLSEKMLSSLNHYQHIIDFVPHAEEAKKAARIRYKQYQQAGCSMQFQSADN